MASKTDNFKKKNRKNSNLGALIGSVIILLIVVVSFVLSPMLSDLGKTQMSDIVLGSYGKEKVTFSFLNDTPFKRELASISSSSSDSMDPRLAAVAYNRAMAKAAAIDDFNTNGYVISKKQLDDAVIKSGYYNVNGVFSSKVFKNTTEAAKQELRDTIERELKVQSWMYNNYTQQKRSSKYLEFISSMSNNKRNFDYVTFNYSEYPENLVADYADENAKKFTEFNLSRITVNKKSTADEIVKKIANGEATFAELAPMYSTDSFKDNGGEMNSSTFEYELESVFGITNSDDIFKLEVNGTPYIIEKDDSVILLTLNKKIVEPSFENLSKVRDYMLSYERGTIEDYYYSIINNNTTENLENLGEEIKATGLFSLNFGGDQLISTSIDRVSKDSIFSRATSNENFFTTLFNLEENTLSEPIVLGDSISVFKLTEEVSDETNTNSYILSNLDRTLMNYKDQVGGDLVRSSEKYNDNFYTGYYEILKINRGY